MQLVDTHDMKSMQSMCKLLYAVFDLLMYVVSVERCILIDFLFLVMSVERSKTAYNSLHIDCIVFMSWVSKDQENHHNTKWRYRGFISLFEVGLSLIQSVNSKKATIQSNNPK